MQNQTPAQSPAQTNSQSVAQEPPRTQNIEAISLPIAEHGISYYIPPGASIQGEINVPGGALICGNFAGILRCASGSVVIQDGAVVCGHIEADRIFTEGQVVSILPPAEAGKPAAGDLAQADQDSEPSEASSLSAGLRSTLIARHSIAASPSATIDAEVWSRSFALHQCNILGMMHSIAEDGEIPPIDPILVDAFGGAQRRSAAFARALAHEHAADADQIAQIAHQSAASRIPTSPEATPAGTQQASAAAVAATTREQSGVDESRPHSSARASASPLKTAHTSSPPASNARPGTHAAPRAAANQAPRAAASLGSQLSAAGWMKLGIIPVAVAVLAVAYVAGQQKASRASLEEQVEKVSEVAPRASVTGGSAQNAVPAGAVAVLPANAATKVALANPQVSAASAQAPTQIQAAPPAQASMPPAQPTQPAPAANQTQSRAASTSAATPTSSQPTQARASTRESKSSTRNSSNSNTTATESSSAPAVASQVALPRSSGNSSSPNPSAASSNSVSGSSGQANSTPTSSSDATSVASPASREELVPATVAAVSKIDVSAVVMTSGATIPIGGHFKSGERLLAVDPENSRIVTDRRTIVLTR